MNVTVYQYLKIFDSFVIDTLLNYYTVT